MFKRKNSRGLAHEHRDLAGRILEAASLQSRLGPRLRLNSFLTQNVVIFGAPAGGANPAGRPAPAGLSQLPILGINFGPGRRSFFSLKRDKGFIYPAAAVTPHGGGQRLCICGRGDIWNDGTMGRG